MRKVAYNASYARFLSDFILQIAEANIDKTAGQVATSWYYIYPRYKGLQANSVQKRQISTDSHF